MRRGSYESVGALAFMLLVAGAAAVFYLACLLAVQLTVTVKTMLSAGGRERVDPSSDRLTTTAAVFALWTLGTSILVGLVFASATAWLIGLCIGGAVGAVSGWKVGNWQGAISWAELRGALVLGTRAERFFLTRPFTVTPGERLKHLVVTGATGTGKSTLLRSLIVQDIRAGSGLAVIDPKDDLIDGVLPHIHNERIGDVIVFDAADTRVPLGLNPLSAVPAEQRSLATSELISVFRRQFAEAWGPRQEHLFRHCILALLEVPGSTLLDVPRLLLDEEFLRRVAFEVSNPAVREFLLVEYERVLRRRGDAIEPILNKLGAWLAYPELRAIIGQPRSSFDFRSVMDRGKILLVRIPAGSLGDDASNLLGALIVARIQLAAQSRVDMPQEARRPFTLFVDEFSRFVTSSFERILSEARGFKLGLVCANQYFEQLPRDVQLALTHNAATFVQTRYSRGRYSLEVVSRAGADGDGSVFEVQPPRPLPPGDLSRAAEVRARSRLRYGRAVGSDEPLGARASGNGRQPSAAGRWGRDVDEE